MSTNFECISSRITLDLPHQIWEAQSVDPAGQTIMTRFFHNTPSFVINNYLRCYLSYFSLDFLTSAFTIIGAVLFLIGLYFLFRRHQWKLLTVLLIAPLPALFEFPANVLFRAVVIFSAEIVVMGYAVSSLVKRKQ